MGYREHFILAMAFTGITTLILGFFVYFRNIKNKVYQIFSVYSLSIAWWSLAQIGTAYGPTLENSWFWSRFEHIGVAFIPTFFLHFVILFLNLKNKKRLLIVSYALSAFFTLSIPIKLLVSNVTHKLDGMINYGNPGPFYTPLVIFFTISVSNGLWKLFFAYKNATGLRRNQLKYLCWSSLFGYLGGSANFLLIYDISIPILNPFGTYLVGIYALVFAYAIVKYRLLDINIALTRAGIFIIVYILVLGIPLGLTGWGKYWLQGLFGQNWYWTSLILAIILATLGPFIYIYLDRRAEERLLKEQRHYQNTLKQASVGMTRIRNLRKLLDLITHIVTKSVKIAYAGIYLYNKETNEFVLQVMRDKGRMPIPKLTLDNPLISYITAKRQPLVYEEIKRLSEDTNDVTYKHLVENMRLLTASVVIPSFLEDRFMGFFVLGEKTSGQIYTPDDLNVFGVLATQSALAIENARFFEETKQMQEQIATAEKMATIGTMADGLSHQINNRFYALSLIAADTIDTIKMTDTSNCSPEIKEAFSQISHALERVKANVMQGGQVVRGILKYTRKGEEGFEPLSLDQILDGALAMVQYKINLSEIDIIRNYPKDHPRIKGNLVQLQEPFFNFIDNGYDSTVERKTILKEAGYRGKLTFSAQTQENGMLLITIEDNGMGIKEEDKKKLFTPFFTTKVSSRQGTGLGLYVVKRVIEEFHQGKIWFESEYGQGTRFFLQLSIAKE